MAQDNSNSTMEMGTSDQVLVATKRKKTLGYIIGGVAMLAVIGVVITLIVVLSGNEAGVAEPIVSTERPTSPISPGTVSTTTTIAPTTTIEPPTTEALPAPLELEEIIEGVYSPPSFNATWATGSEVLFRNSNGDLVLYDVDSDSTTPLVRNSSQILQQSGRVMQLSADNTHVILASHVAPIYRYSFLARYTAVNILTGDTVAIKPADIDTDEVFLQNFVWGPSGTSLAFVYLNNIYYQSSLTAEPRQITSTGVVDKVYNGIPDWVYEEEVFGSNNAMWFSNDGTKLAFVTFDDENVEVMKVPHYGVPGSVDFQYTKHHQIHYPKAGTINPDVAVTLIDVTTNVFSPWQGPTDLTQPILKAVKFVSNIAVALVWTNRVQTVLIVQQCTLAQTTCTTIFSHTETDGWIDNIPFIFNDVGNAFITILPQTVEGVQYKQIVQVTAPTTGTTWTSQNRVNQAHTVLEILKWTSDNVIWYKATSVSDSAEQHIYTVNAAGAVACFTCGIVREDGGQCLYNEATINNEGTRITVNCAGPDVPQIFIFSTDGSLVRVWDDSADLVAATNDRVMPTTIRLSVPSAVAGLPDADVHIQAPADFADRTNVPLLVYVYGGPDTALVTKQWSLDWGSSLVSRWGIAIAYIDGRGSGLRGVANMFALNKKLGTVEVEDQITVTKHLQDNLSWIDGNRTCIWGWSYGGYAASKALAEGGDVFRCAAAVAPVVDWRFYDTIYTERYMDQPSDNPEGYAVSSLLSEKVVEAFREKSYFLIHGTADDNVHYQHAMLLSRLLQRRDVYFTQMSYTDEDHGLIGVRPHLYHALEKFLQEYML